MGPLTEEDKKIPIPITVGHLVLIFTLVSAILATYYNIRNDMRAAQDRLDGAEKSIARNAQSQQQMVDSLYDIRKDIAVIRDRIERQAPIGGSAPKFPAP